MVLDCEKARLEGARSSSDGQLDMAREDKAYSEAFRRFGIDPAVLGPREIADRALSTTIRLELASELDNWAFVRHFMLPSGDELETKLAGAARLADPDELRNRVRDAMEARHKQALSELLQTEFNRIVEWPTSRLVFLALYRTEQWDELKKLSLGIQRQRPDDYWINHILAGRCVQADPPQWEDAARFYTAALALRPENPAIQNDLAWFLTTWPGARAEHFEEAIALGKKAVKTTPAAGNYWGTLGIAHFRAEQWSEALTAFQQAAKLRDGGDSLDHFHLAMVYGRLGETQQARLWYDRGAEWMENNDPDNGELKQLRAAAAELLGIKESSPAENWLKQLLKRGATE